ncbi:phytanoyl-CoA dioxygenase [Brachybacterium sp. P6-10-X1]|uniref:phytanoyl-CoA dioxygenase family protein n=1 Tax=Brachybacterium sp. P6-10-X1 TaxID=1903186 RepID=UPI0009717971|nr:phytanoyl-CoA dioxygenase family protein [Brachybacterium sp. P6-10-X1]APX32297.1 phytanoyl-CoA dioxygenase [Brachybacterium sp. P6-10-X1]
MVTSNGYVLDETSRRLGGLEPVPDAQRRDRDALWERLRRDGYLFLPRQLSPDHVLAFRRYYFAQMSSTGLVRPGSDPVEGLQGAGDVDRAMLRHQLFSQIVPSDEYRRFCAQPEIRGFFSWLLGDEVHLHRRKIIRHTRPGEFGIGTATQAHYDLVYLREGTDRVLSIWIPLGDCPISRGGLAYLEGSHHQVLADEARDRLPRPARSITADLPGLADDHDARWLITDYRAGDVVVHSAHIVHAALDNVDPNGVMRLSTDIRYQRSTDPIDWRWQDHWTDSDGL